MNKEKAIEWVLRIALAGEFIGHGVFAVQAKTRFVEMLTLTTGIANPLATKLIILIGILDILVGIGALLFPFRLLLVWATAWGFLTALARPLAGDPIWDFVERWANWGVPLALLLIRGIPKKAREWFQ
ncbi:MAG TPA: hypothetical protein VJK51_05025 [Candidatus Nanoarchaeia archaeon]|nr:hypothetical protein [Candidatus Nanoarchaeia archaeon]